MLLLLLFIFLSGVVTIFAPCIWPLLPIILSASASGGHRKPLGIVLGIMSSFTVFTLSLSYILKVIPFDPDGLRLVAVVIIGFLGIVLVVPALGARLEGFVSRLSGRLGGVKAGSSGFWGGFTTGFALGAVWSPCAGPILATVAALAATQAVNAYVVLITLVFVAGVGLPLFIFSFLSQRILLRTRALSPYTGRIQQAFGILMILAAIMIYTGYDRVLQVKILEAFPQYGNFLNSLEKSEQVSRGLDNLVGKKEDALNDGVFRGGVPSGGLQDYGTAPEFTGIEAWLNTDGEPLTMAGLRGKVVLIDFWTYSCINCIRTFPYLKEWHAKYKDVGLVIVGVHTPEFNFEKEKENVVKAMERYGLTYPAAQDNAYATWYAYGNKYWPASYLIDATGQVRYIHFGEGEYAETEAAIRTLLEENGKKLGALQGISEEKIGTSGKRTPESYLGSERIERLGSPEKISARSQVFTVPNTLASDQLAFSGTWQIEKERAVSGTGSAIHLNFQGGKVFLVMAPPTTERAGKVRVYLDDKLVDATLAGSDVKQGVVTVESDRLYELIDFRGESGRHLLRLEFETGGTSAYAFTFG